MAELLRELVGHEPRTVSALPPAERHDQMIGAWIALSPAMSARSTGANDNGASMNLCQRTS